MTVEIDRAPRAEEAREYVNRIERFRQKVAVPTHRARPDAHLPPVHVSALLAGFGILMSAASFCLRFAPEAPPTLAIRAIVTVILGG